MDKTNRYVFIVGSPRSGTTLLQSLLMTQNRVISVPETFYFDFFASYKAEQVILKSQVKKYVNFIEHQLGKEFSIQLSKKLNNCNRLKNKRTFFDNIFSIFYYIKNNKTNHRNQFLLEKTPSHIHFIEDIYDCFVNANIIGIIRHPVHCVSSSIKHWSEKSSKLRKLREYALNWVEGNEYLIEYNKIDGRLMIVKYENLISESERTIEEICNEIGLSFNSETITDYSNYVDKITTKKEVWKMNNKSQLKKCEKELNFWKRMSLEVWVVQYYTYQLQEKLDLKIYNKFLQKCIINKIIFITLFIRRQILRHK